MKDKQVSLDKQNLNNAILQLTKAYQNNSLTSLNKAIKILKGVSSEAEAPPVAVRADQVEIKPAKFIPFGVKWLDKWLGGGARLEEMILWVDNPGGSKTHMLKWFGSQFLSQGYEVLDVSGEDIASDVLQYYSSAVAQRYLKNLWLADMARPFSVEDVEAIIHNVRSQGARPTVAIVDHLDLMEKPWAHNDVAALTAVASELKFLFKREKMVGFTASQALFSGQGLGKIYGSKVGKAGNVDVIFIVDDSDGEYYNVGLYKARGRKKTKEQHKTLQANWDKMEVNDT